MRTFLLLILSMAQVQQPSVLRQDSSTAINAAAPPSRDIYGEINGKIIRETPHFQIYAENELFPADLEWFQAEAEVIYAYVSERMGTGTGERFAVTIRPPDKSPCPIRGLARSDQPVAQAIVFANEKTSRDQIGGVLAHEVAHLLHARAWKVGSSSVDLAEGLASWAAGKYWEVWQKTPSSDAVRSFQKEGRYLALMKYFSADQPDFDAQNGNCLAERDLRYTSWAAFADFLIVNNGMEKLRQLLGPVEPEPPPRPPIGGRGGATVLPPFPIAEINFPNLLMNVQLIRVAPQIPDFQGVYGQTLEELEKAWWEQLRKGQ